MSPDTLMAAAALVTSLGLGGGGLWATLANRPKMSADAKAADATAEVGISADARAWAERSDARAEKALERAEKADLRARDAEDRLDAVEDTVRGLVAYVQILQGEVVSLGGHPTPPPRNLIPPLSPH